MWCQESRGAVSSTQRALGGSVASSTAVSTMPPTDCLLVQSSTASWLVTLETPKIAINIITSVGRLKL